MRTHTTSTLRKLIFNDMDATKHKVSKQEIQTWMTAMPIITKEMFKVIDFFVRNMFEKRTIIEQITQIRKESIALLNLLDRFQTLALELRPLKKAVVCCLDAVLDKIRYDCQKILDDDVNMATIHLKRDRILVENQLDLLRSYFIRFKIDYKLQCLIKRDLDCFKKLKTCTYTRMNYVLKVLSSLNTVLETASAVNAEHSLIEALVNQNYNSTAFITYFLHTIEIELDNLVEYAEKRRLLNYYQMNFESKQSKKNTFSFDPAKKNVGTFLEAFICEKRNALALEEQLKKQASVQLADMIKPADPMEGDIIVNTIAVTIKAKLVKMIEIIDLKFET